MRHTLQWICGLAAMSCGVVQAAATDQELIDRLLRRDALTFRGFAPGATAAQNSELDFGLSFAKLQSGEKDWEIPLTYIYSFTDNDKLSVATGVLRTDDGSLVHSGMDDVGVRFQHTARLAEEVSGSVLIGAIVPTGGAVGSVSATQLVQGGIKYHPAGHWSAAGSVAYVHINDAPTGVDTSGAVIAISTAYKSDTPNLGANFKLSRKQRGGTDNPTTGEVEFDHPFGTSSFTGALILDHGFTSGHRDNSIEYDFCLTF